MISTKISSLMEKRKRGLSLLFLLLFLPCLLSAQVVQEVRAAWFTTLNGLDWPAFPARTAQDVERQKADLRQQFDALERMGINVVLFQSRIRATVAYQSDIEPWDPVFTGTAGRAPYNFDPLAFAIEEAHARGMELHAWMVAFPAMKIVTARQLGNKSLPSRQPTLVQRSGDAWIMDPGVPATASYIARLCQEVAERYDIDGIHLDYIRYPERGVPFNDNATYRRYGRGMERNAWRRANVTSVVRAVHDAVRAIKPWVKLSCSPVGKYADLSRYSAGGWNARNAVSQEAQQWLQDGLMDWLFPMMYFEGNNFYPFALDWVEQSGGRPVIPGLGIYFLAPEEKNWPLTTIVQELHFLRHIGAGGQAFFRTRYLLRNVKDLRRFLQDDFYATPALVPPMTWLDSVAPASPQLTIERKNYALQLSWTPSPDAHNYNIYRIDTLGHRHLLRRRFEGTSFTYRPALPSMLNGHFHVTAVDRYGNESQ